MSFKLNQTLFTLEADVRIAFMLEKNPIMIFPL